VTAPVLYDYYRSSAAYRVRIALNLKQVDYRTVTINLAENAHKEAGFRKISPQGFVPLLEVEGLRLHQSLAIIDWLDRWRPDPPLLPSDPADRARVQAMALTIACDVHPLNNLRVLKYLSGPLGLDEAARGAWYRQWVQAGFDALEQQAGEGPFLFGETPTLADICLVPQIYNARRFDVPIDDYPKLVRADAAAAALETFAAAHPDRVATAADSR